jgi:hypothetical protein
MSQRTTPTSADRVPALRRLSATPGEWPSSHCQFVRFSLGASAGCVARSIPMRLRHIRGNEGASRALNRTNTRQPLYPHHRPSHTGRKSLSPASIGPLSDVPMATSLVHQHFKQREMGQLTLSHPGGIRTNAAWPHALFCFLPGGFESGRCKLTRAGEASSVRARAYRPTLHDQHYRLSPTLPGEPALPEREFGFNIIFVASATRAFPAIPRSHIAPRKSGARPRLNSTAVAGARGQGAGGGLLRRAWG